VQVAATNASLRTEAPFRAGIVILVSPFAVSETSDSLPVWAESYTQPRVWLNVRVDARTGRSRSKSGAGNRNSQQPRRKRKRQPIWATFAFPEHDTR